MDIPTSLISFLNEGIISGKASSTLDSYKETVEYFIKHLNLNFVSMEMNTLNRETIERFFIWGIKVRKWSRIYHWTIYQKLNVYFVWCVKRNLIEKNPLTDIPKPRVAQLPPKSLSEKDAIRLMQVVSGLKTHYYFTTLRNKALVAAMLFTGIRKNELMNLRTEDVDLLNGFIAVEKGKGGKKREIPLELTTLKPILEEYLNYRLRLGKDNEWFFNGTFSGRGDGKIAVSTIDRLFTGISKLMGKRVSSHRLRHSFATILLDKTGDIYTLQQLMGHSNIATTCVYLSSTRRKKVEAISQMKLDGG